MTVDIYGLPSDAVLERSTSTPEDVDTELYHSKLRRIYILLKFERAEDLVLSHKITFDDSLGEEFAANLERELSKGTLNG